MCGLAGFLSRGNITDGEIICRRMADALVHRGPDDSGVWLDQGAGIALGHRRLAIQDLSVEGHQPMPSPSGRYVVAYNGEIYNFRALRKEFEGLGVVFRGHSDTEVLLAAIEVWGLEQSIKCLVGMFAFALWDKNEQTLSLVRDRMGEKPLYYGWQGKSFLFGSELKALAAHPAFAGEIDRDALTLLLRHNYIPAPHSIYKGIRKLTPGAILQLPASLSPGAMPEPQAYWQAKEAAEYGARNPLELEEDEAVDALDSLLRETIRDKMIADVPLGAFLSGGIDSSAVVALMQAESSRPVRTFSIGFHEEGYNEAEHAKAVAKHLGTDHTELYVTPGRAMGVIPKLPALYDEPFSDSSQIPTFLVSEMTKEHVTVALSGDGGDELFCGYPRYFLANALWRKLGRIPVPLRDMAAVAIRALPYKGWDMAFGWLAPVLSRYGRPGSVGDKMHKAAELLSIHDERELYRRLVSHWKLPSDVVIGAFEPLTALTDKERGTELKDFMHLIQYLDMVSYLPDDILTKVDRAAMGVSLETRMPLLDHRVVEFVWTLPLSMKVRGGQGKWLLRQVLDRYVPRQLVERPKMGFGVPIDAWLRGPLRDWAEALLDEGRLRQEGYFSPDPIRQKWVEHLSGTRNWQYHLWDVLMFQAWLEEQRS